MIRRLAAVVLLLLMVALAGFGWAYYVPVHDRALWSQVTDEHARRESRRQSIPPEKNGCTAVFRESAPAAVGEISMTVQICLGNPDKHVTLEAVARAVGVHAAGLKFAPQLQALIARPYFVTEPATDYDPLEDYSLLLVGSTAVSYYQGKFQQALDTALVNYAWANKTLQWGSHRAESLEMISYRPLLLLAGSGKLSPASLRRLAQALEPLRLSPAEYLARADEDFLRALAEPDPARLRANSIPVIDAFLKQRQRNLAINGYLEQRGHLDHSRFSMMADDLAALKLIVALERYRQDSGRYPDELNRLVPRYLTDLHVERLDYHPGQREYSLTSTGPEHEDIGRPATIEYHR